MKIRNASLMAMVLFVVVSATGCGGGGAAHTLAAPTLEAIRTALSLNNAYGIVPGLTLGDITLPACTQEDGSAVDFDVTYAVSDLPAWLAFDATTRALTLAEGTTVPADALSISEVTYGCAEATAAAAQTVAKADPAVASQAFMVNDLDGGGVADGYEYEFGEVPLAGNTGWFWLTPGTVEPYRSGTGAFMIPTGIDIVSSGMDPTDATDDTSDFDGDAIANNDEITNMTNIFVAASDGTFGTATTYTTGTGPGAIAAGDLNGDGNLDLAVANRDGTSKVFVLFGDGTGGFGNITSYAGDRPVGLGIADINGDGHLDIATVDFGAATVSIYLNNGDGTFAAGVGYAKFEAAGQLALGDFDGDGDVDIAATNGIYSPTTTLSVFLGNGDGTLATRVDYTVGDVPSDVTVADLDGDGDLDIIVANNGDKNISVLLGNGDGTFADAVNYDTSDDVFHLAAADFNGDGNIDIVTSNGSGDDLSVILGNGDGTLDVDNKTDYTTPLSPGGVLAADLDGDGDVDLAYCISGGGGGSTIDVRLNDGSGAFGDASSYTVDARPTRLTTGDFNRDGKLDIANAHFTPNDPAVILNQ